MPTWSLLGLQLAHIHLKACLKISVEVAQRRYVLREVERYGTQPRASEDETYPEQKEKAREGGAESVRSCACTHRQWNGCQCRNNLVERPKGRPLRLASHRGLSAIAPLHCTVSEKPTLRAIALNVVATRQPRNQ